jgi:hypothetical protein
LFSRKFRAPRNEAERQAQIHELRELGLCFGCGGKHRRPQCKDPYLEREYGKDKAIVAIIRSHYGAADDDLSDSSEERERDETSPPTETDEKTDQVPRTQYTERTAATAAEVGIIGPVSSWHDTVSSDEEITA